MSEKDIQITDSNKNNIYPITKLKNVTHENSNAEHALSDSESNIQTESNKIFNALKSLQDSLGNIKTSSGNAKSEDVLEGKTFSNKDGTDLTGTMKNYGDKIITPNKSIQTLNNGFYNNLKINPIDSSVLQSNFPELKPENIISGVNIQGIVGDAIVVKKINGNFYIPDITYLNEATTKSIKINHNIKGYVMNLMITYLRNGVQKEDQINGSQLNTQDEYTELLGSSRDIGYRSTTITIDFQGFSVNSNTFDIKIKKNNDDYANFIKDIDIRYNIALF